MANQIIINLPIGEVVYVNGRCYAKDIPVRTPPDANPEAGYEDCETCAICGEESSCVGKGEVHWLSLIIPPEADTALFTDEVMFWADKVKRDWEFPGFEYDGNTCPAGTSAQICSIIDSELSELPDHYTPQDNTPGIETSPPVLPSTDPEDSNDLGIIEGPPVLEIEMPTPCPTCAVVSGASPAAVNGQYTLVQTTENGCVWENGVYRIVAETSSDWYIRDYTFDPAYVDLYTSTDGIDWGGPTVGECTAGSRKGASVITVSGAGESGVNGDYSLSTNRSHTFNLEGAVWQKGDYFIRQESDNRIDILRRSDGIYYVQYRSTDGGVTWSVYEGAAPAPTVSVGAGGMPSVRTSIHVNAVLTLIPVENRPGIWVSGTLPPNMGGGRVVVKKVGNEWYLEYGASQRKLQSQPGERYETSPKKALRFREGDPRDDSTAQVTIRSIDKLQPETCPQECLYVSDADEGQGLYTKEASVEGCCIWRNGSYFVRKCFQPSGDFTLELCKDASPFYLVLYSYNSTDGWATVGGSEPLPFLEVVDCPSAEDENLGSQIPCGDCWLIETMEEFAGIYRPSDNPGFVASGVCVWYNGYFALVQSISDPSYFIIGDTQNGGLTSLYVSYDGAASWEYVGEPYDAGVSVTATQITCDSSDGSSTSGIPILRQICYVCAGSSSSSDSSLSSESDGSSLYSESQSYQSEPSGDVQAVRYVPC